jgi:cob(I)alamin adenosyltransferase
VRIVETWIDALDASLPPLKNFILPAGGRASAALHVARATCRRAERQVVRVAAADASSSAVPAAVLAYCNRLSDFLFVAARYAAHVDGCPDVIYRPCAASTVSANVSYSTSAASASTATSTSLSSSSSPVQVKDKSG